jgi:hypothetical protein
LEAVRVSANAVVENNDEITYFTGNRLECHFEVIKS